MRSANDIKHAARIGHVLPAALLRLISTTAEAVLRE
jgi:hypothetical protein